MDGIAGIVYPDVFQMNDLIQPMLNTLKHRGGTRKDVHNYKNIEIGMCGQKLATSGKMNIVAGIDGSIYNLDELTKELKDHGHRLQNHDPSEIVLHAYEVWGNGLFEKLTGDFAIVILDKRKKRILLARDRIGKKPLYWFQNQHHFIFASELKALLATGAVPQTPAMDALSTYLYFGYIPQDMSPIQGVSKLLPAHFMQYNFDGSKTIQSYWSYSSYFESDGRKKKKAIVEHLDHLLNQCVQVRIPATGNTGCFVSGGLGSASIAYYLKNLAKNGVSAFSVGYQGQNDQDIEAAKIITDILGFPHDCFAITPETFLDDLVKISWHLDEPLADPNITATWKLAQLAADKTNTVFSGMGSDELLAGHSRYSLAEQQVSAFSNIFQSTASIVRQALIPILNVLYKPGAYELVKQSRTNPWQFEYLRHNALFDEKELAKASPRLAGIFDPEVFLHKFHHLYRIKSTVSSFLYFDVKTRLADCFSLQYERLTAAHSLDWRTPFMDRHITEYLASLPEPEFLTEQETASYLKAIMKDVFPESVVDRPKRTRKYFLQDWIASPELQELFHILKKGTLVDMGLIAPQWLDDQIKKLPRNKHVTRYLWAILALEIWFRLYINRPIGTYAPNISVKELLLEK